MKAKLPAKRLRGKEISVPKRELEALVIGGKLLVKLKDTYKNIYNLEPHIFSDSQIVLNWVSNKSKVNQFVDNRVQLFTKLSGETPIHFIDTKNNPADHVSRGMTSTDYLDKEHILWRGPDIMHNETLVPFKPDPTNEAEIGAITISTLTKEASILNLIKNCKTLERGKG